MKRLIHHKPVLWALVCSVAVLFNPATLSAQTVNASPALSFGRFVIVDFDDPIEIVIDNNGNVTTNANVYIIDDPILGEYTLEDAPTDSVYSITVPPSATLGGPGGNFILDQITVGPAVLVTDSNGDDEFTLGGRLRSAGGGTPYGDGIYTNTFSIIFNF